MKHLNITILLVLGVFISSCDSDFLEPAPTAAIDATTFYSTEAELETGIINMYDGIQGLNSTRSNDNHAIQIEYYVTEMRSDNTRTKSSEGEAAQFESFSLEANNGIIDDYYRSFYNVIYRANIVLDNLDVTSEENRGKFEGEAKFVRAYAYFNLVRLFGDIPLIDRITAPLETDIAFTRVSTTVVYDLIISDLSIAIANLDNTYKTRASKAAAQALLAKVYLTQKTNYTEAQSLCESVINSGFSLESNFKDVFYNEENNEIIFAIGFLSDDSRDSQNFSAEWLNAVGRTSGVNYVTPEVRVALDEFGGDRTAFSYRKDVLETEQYQVVKYLPNGDENLGISPTSSDPRLAGNDWIILRYSDVLLMHVEAIMAGSAETSSASALSSFQQVRDRAGLTDVVSNVSKQELLDERRVELAFENHRLFDLIRFEAANDVLSAFSAENNYSFSATDLLLPIPQREINLSNGLLKQNPGY
ncbi:MAG: RagB/SusD family nutrient uptake outer membrane protein [Flavobacteriaceae bacterium]|nr:RagB/SusD family nutrient uptake outer membrane protein [Flavobacteriaceae bacterium]